jgi:hypothetical protein
MPALPPKVTFAVTVRMSALSHDAHNRNEFIGFSAIVMLLRQSLGRKLRPFDALFAHVYMEFGLIVSVGAMLPPLFALWNLSPLDVWRLSSALVGIPLLFLGVTYPARRRSASGERTPFYVRVNVSIVILISVALLLTAIGVFHEKSPAMFTSALTGFLTFAVAAWLGALNLILLRKSH